MAAIPKRFVKGQESPSKTVKTITADSVALVSLLWEEGLPLKVYFHRLEEKKVRGWFWLNVAARLGFSQKEKLSEQVCRPCGRKIRNAAQLYSFTEKAVSTEGDVDFLLARHAIWA